MRKGLLALRLMRDDVFTGEFAFLDLASEAITRLKRPTAKSVPLEASALANAVVFQRTATDGDEVLLVRDGAGHASLYCFNDHFVGVVEAKPVFVTSLEPSDDETRSGWL